MNELRAELAKKEALLAAVKTKARSKIAEAVAELKKKDALLVTLKAKTKAYVATQQRESAERAAMDGAGADAVLSALRGRLGRAEEAKSAAEARAQ